MNTLNRHLFGIVFILSAIFHLSLFAGTVFVDLGQRASLQDGSEAYPYSTVQEAIDNSGRVCVIKIAGGIYNENIKLPEDRGIRILGGYQSGNFSQRDAEIHRTVISGLSSRAVITIDYTGGYGDYQVYEIDGLTIEGGERGISAMNWGNGGTALLIVSNNLIQNNGGLTGSNDYGGGVMSKGMIPEIRDNIIQNNSCGKAGGLFVQLNTTEYSFLIEGNIIQDNVIYSDHGAGAGVQAYKGLIKNNTFHSNRILEGWGWGGGLIIDGNCYAGFSDEDYIELVSNVYSNNETPSGGSGLFIDEGANVRMKNELIINNICHGSGRNGALYVDGPRSNSNAKTIFENCTIADNIGADYSYGHAVYVEGGSEVIGRNSIFWGNRSDDNENDFYIDSTSSLIIDYSIYMSGSLGSGYFSISNSIQEDPLFAAPTYYLRSQTGRYNPATGLWVADPVHSPGIDGGDPLSDYSLEPDPNGGKINMGCYGNTIYASMSAGGGPPDLQSAVISFNNPAFTGTYIWSYDDSRSQDIKKKGSSWNKISEMPADKIMAGDITGDSNIEIIAGFPGMGLWYYRTGDNTWVNLMGAEIACIDFTLARTSADTPLQVAASFEGLGLYLRQINGSWTRLISAIPTILASAGFDNENHGIDELLIVFSGVNGLFKYDFTNEEFARLVIYSPMQMLPADITNNGHDEIICVFENAGACIGVYEEGKGMTWNRIIYVLPQEGHRAGYANISGGPGKEVFLPYNGRTYYYNHETSTWHTFLYAPLRMMIPGHFTGTGYDDIIACEGIQESVYLYRASTSTWELMAFQGEPSAMAGF